MNINTDLVLFVAWMILAVWAVGLAVVFTAYLRGKREFERDMRLDMERHRR